MHALATSLAFVGLLICGSVHLFTLRGNSILGYALAMACFIGVFPMWFATVHCAQRAYPNVGRMIRTRPAWMIKTLFQYCPRPLLFPFIALYVVLVAELVVSFRESGTRSGPQTDVGVGSAGRDFSAVATAFCAIAVPLNASLIARRRKYASDG